MAERERSVDITTKDASIVSCFVSRTTAMSAQYRIIARRCGSSVPLIAAGKTRPQHPALQCIRTTHCSAYARYVTDTLKPYTPSTPNTYPTKLCLKPLDPSEAHHRVNQDRRPCMAHPNSKSRKRITKGRELTRCCASSSASDSCIACNNSSRDLTCEGQRRLGS
eukprot:1001942-Rhodomonas_salina.1